MEHEGGKAAICVQYVGVLRYFSVCLTLNGEGECLVVGRSCHGLLAVCILVSTETESLFSLR